MIFNKLFQYPMPNDMFKNNWEEAGEREMARRRTTRGSAQERGPLRHGVTIYALNESKEKATMILSLVREMDTKDLL